MHNHRVISWIVALSCLGGHFCATMVHGPCHPGVLKSVPSESPDSLYLHAGMDCTIILGWKSTNLAAATNSIGFVAEWRPREACAAPRSNFVSRTLRSQFVLLQI